MRTLIFIDKQVVYKTLQYMIHSDNEKNRHAIGSNVKELVEESGIDKCASLIFVKDLFLDVFFYLFFFSIPFITLINLNYFS